MLSDFLKKNITSQADYVEYGYGQVEPNHLSARHTGQIYGQLPAAADIKVLEQGQFVKYDYASGLVNFTGSGEWMLVFNEIKLYREGQLDCEFAMVKDNYQARIYSPYGQPETVKQSRYYNGVDAEGNTAVGLGAKTSYTVSDGKITVDEVDYAVEDGVVNYKGIKLTVTEDNTVEVPAVVYAYDDVTAGEDPYELHYNEDPFHILSGYKPAKMPEGTTMVPRVFKTNVGDIFTTNTVAETELAVNDVLSPRAADGLLSKSGDNSMKWQVVKVYTMPDNQKGVKIMRIA